MTDWRVQLSGPLAQLAKLPGWFTDDLARVVVDGDVFLLESSEFVNETSPAGVLAVARELVELMTGAALQVHGERVDLIAANVRQTDADGRSTTHVMIEAAIEMRSTLRLAVIRDDGATENIEPQDIQADVLLQVAHLDDAVADVLAYLARQHDWHNLWKLWEVIELDVVRLDWATKADSKRFRVSAHNRSVSGRDARHAVSRGSVPSVKPMTILEGDVFVSGLVKRWLEHRVKEFLNGS